MDVSIFEIPLLRDEIAQYLLPYNLARCCLVSKEWNTWFTSLLWRDIIVTAGSNTQVYGQYQNHMRSIISLGDKIYLRLLCPNLRRLNCDTFTYAMLETASRSPLLQDLIIRNFSILKPDGLRYLLKALQCLPLLRNLHLHFSYRISTAMAQLIIEASRHFESLYLSWEPYSPGCRFGWPEQGYEVESVKSAMDQMEDIQFRKLAIGLPSDEQESIILIPLLEKCHLLECLHLIYLYSRDSAQKISHVLRSNPRRRLRNLHIGGERGYTISDHIHHEDLINLFRAVGDQENEYGKCVKSNEEGGIQTLTLSGDLHLHAPVIQALYRYLSNSLIDLNLRSIPMSPEDLASFACHLPNLKSFKVSIQLQEDEKESELEHICHPQWTCLKIQKLDLRTIIGQFRSHRTDSYALSYEYIFSQIGKCTELEELELGPTLHVLTQDNGYLKHLIGLKQLKSLGLRSYVDIKEFTYEDMKWMLEHWPRLNHFQTFVEGRWHQSLGVRYDREISPVIKYLQTARPWLVIN